MANEIRLESTTNTADEVRQALGVKAAPVTEAPATPPAAEEPPAPAAEEPKVPAAAAPAKDEPEDDTDDAAADASEAGKALASRRSRLQIRIDNLTREKYTTLAERDAARAETTRLQRELEALKAGKTPDVSEKTTSEPAEKPATFDKPRPKQEDFETFEEYEKKVDEWRDEKAEFIAEQKIAAREKRDRDAREQAERAADAKRHQEALKGRFDKAREKHPDFDEVFNQAKDMPLSVAVRDHLMFSEMGAEVAYFLMQHPDEAERLSSLHPGVALVELGKLEAKLEAGTIGAASDAPPPAADEPPVADPKPAPPKVPVSKAPAPITRPGASSTASTKPLDEEEYQNYKKRRQEQIAASHAR